MMILAESLVVIAAAYVAVGVVFATVFLWRWIGRVDPAAHSTPTLFKALVFPGLTALWPLMLGKWLRAARPAGQGEHPAKGPTP